MEESRDHLPPRSETERLAKEYADAGMVAAEIAVRLGLNVGQVKDVLSRGVLPDEPAATSQDTLQGPDSAARGVTAFPETAVGAPRPPVSRARLASALGGLALAAGLAAVALFAVDLGSNEAGGERAPLQIERPASGTPPHEEIMLLDRSVHPPPID
jgi:hypothetical protein